MPFWRLLPWAGPRAARTPGADATTKASPRGGASGQVILPPKGDTYEVLACLKGLKSFAVRYADGVVRGGEPCSDQAARTLRGLGIRTIVTITPTDRERALARECGFTLVEMPFDKATGLSQADLRRFLALLTGEKMPVYIHCHGGTHRGGVLCVAYRIHKCGWDWDKALAEHARLGGSLKDDHAMLLSVKTLKDQAAPDPPVP